MAAEAVAAAVGAIMATTPLCGIPSVKDLKNNT